MEAADTVGAGGTVVLSSIIVLLSAVEVTLSAAGLVLSALKFLFSAVLLSGTSAIVTLNAVSVQ